VELRLAVEAALPTTDEKAAPRRHESAPPPPPPPRDAGGAAASAATGDAGGVDALAMPGPPVALWGNPTVFARARTRVPYNVLWIVVDALRPDVIASFHDDAEDAAKQAAPHPPLDALLPKIPGLMPELDALAKQGVRFTRAYSGGSWTRPGTLSMLAGVRSSELGIETERWVLKPEVTARFYASDPPLLPLLLRRQGVATRAFVNNYFMVGYALVGVDMGFERTADHRYRTRDTKEVTEDATRWLRDNKDERFFLFVNYNSPHEPYEPPQQFIDRVPPPPAGPKDKIARLYMAEAAKDDEAIGVLMKALDVSGLRERTIIVVTADHGETLSVAHSGTSGLDKMPVRYHHAVSNYEETARVPILVVAPGLLPADKEVRERVRNVDLAPTVLELLGLELHPRMTGKSLVGLAQGKKEEDERVVLTEGRGTRGLMVGRHRMLVRDGAARTTYLADKVVTVNEELYDLVDDPGERRDLVLSKPDVVLEMRARLAAALKNAPVAGTHAAVAGGGGGGGASPEQPSQPPVLHLRFAGGGHARRVSGAITVGSGKSKPRSIDVVPVELGKDGFKIVGDRIELALTTSPGGSLGLDLVIDPPTTPVTWELYLDDKPWPDELVFGGPYGLVTPALQRGVVSDEARLAAQSPAMPPIDPRRDSGLFVVRERRGEAAPEVHDGEGAEEMARLLREWGYAHGSGGSK
jgi:arylsulfatase A-like enzyme